MIGDFIQKKRFDVKCCKTFRPISFILMVFGESVLFHGTIQPTNNWDLYGKMYSSLNIL